MDDNAYALMDDGEGPFAMFISYRKAVDFKLDNLKEVSAADHGAIKTEPYDGWLSSPHVVQVTTVTPGDPEEDPFSGWILKTAREACVNGTNSN